MFHFKSRLLKHRGFIEPSENINEFSFQNETFIEYSYLYPFQAKVF